MALPAGSNSTARALVAVPTSGFVAVPTRDLMLDAIDAQAHLIVRLRGRLERLTIERERLAFALLFHLIARESLDEPRTADWHVGRLLAKMRTTPPDDLKNDLLRGEPTYPALVSGLAEHDRQSEAAEHERSPP
jgi:hypothetical protein